MAKIGPDGHVKPRDLFSLSSSPMSPKCNLKRPPDNRFVGSPKHQTVSFFCVRICARHTLDNPFLGILHSSNLCFWAFHVFSKLRDLLSISTCPTSPKSNLKASERSCCRQSQTPNRQLFCACLALLVICARSMTGVRVFRAWFASA
jgi:hypothetical protein